MATTAQGNAHRWRHRLAVVSLLAVIGWSASGCVESEEGYVTLAELEKLPELRWVYPGADVLRRASEPRRFGIEGPDAAEVVVSFGSHDDPPAIRGWYTSRLAEAGWEPRPCFAFSSYHVPWFEWEKPGLKLRLRVNERTAAVITDPREAKDAARWEQSFDPDFQTTFGVEVRAASPVDLFTSKTYPGGVPDPMNRGCHRP